MSAVESCNIQAEFVSWKDIRDYVFKINPELGNVIDSIKPGKKFKLIKVKYTYGDVVVDCGSPCLPDINGKLVAISDPLFPKNLRQELNYCPIPLALILRNTNEVFITAGHRVIPLNYFNAGDLFGVFETINPFMGNQSIPMWNVTAGARSVFMLPKITDTEGHNKIRRECGVQEETPANLADHWKIFSQIAHHFPDSWENEVVFFTTDWFEALHNNNAWLPFYKFLFKTYWIQQQIFRDTTEFDLMWESFILAISSRNLKPRPYLIDTLKHLLLIANGAAVAFRPATDETAAPIGLLQECYIKNYGLKNHMPTIIQPCKLDTGNQSAYYSLSYPTVPGTTPYLRNAPSIIEDEREIKRLIETLKNVFTHPSKGLHESIKTTNFELLHSENDPYNEIKNTKDLNKIDTRFNYMAYRNTNNKIFCATAQFMRGCIKVSRKS